MQQSIAHTGIKGERSAATHQGATHHHCPAMSVAWTAEAAGPEGAPAPV